MYRVHPDSWQPARLRAVDHRILMVWLISIAVVRGLDYTTGDDQWGGRDFMIAAAPEWVWGCIGFLAGAAVLTYGVLTRRHLLVYLGHGWLAITYGLNALALLLSTVYDVPALDGVRGAGATSLIAAVHTIAWLRTGPIPLRAATASTTAEVVVTDEEGTAE